MLGAHPADMSDMGRIPPEQDAESRTPEDDRATWTCPDCGAVVVLPFALQKDDGSKPGRTFDRIARLLCGCWVSALSDDDTLRLFTAVMSGDDRAECRQDPRWLESRAMNWIVST
jgi:hypothetical protein